MDAAQRELNDQIDRAAQRLLTIRQRRGSAYRLSARFRPAADAKPPRQLIAVE